MCRTFRSWFTLFIAATSARFMRSSRCGRCAQTSLHASEKITDWRDYWMNVHVPGLRKDIFPQLDLHTRGRVRAARRHRNLIELLETATEKFGAHTALVSHYQSGEQSALSYRELRDRAARAALDAGQSRSAARRSRAADW